MVAVALTSRGRWVAPPDRANGKKTLQEISKRTARVYSEVSKKQRSTSIYSDISTELRNQYSLRHTPNAHASPGYRRIKVTVS